MRFGFGKNWASYLKVLNEERIATAEESLRDMLKAENLRDKTFLDVGCGSGLFSLAAARLGAEMVYSFDYDPECVECAKELRRRYYQNCQWRIERGDALDRDYLLSLGSFDLVYCWGVLHHTGDMWRGLDFIVDPVKKPGGQLFLAVYNDEGESSRYWLKVKRTYCQLPWFLKIPYLLYYTLKIEYPQVKANILQRKHPWGHWQEYYLSRGMSRWHDIKDWVGGYPFEFATAQQIISFIEPKGFRLERLLTGEANNQFLFTRE